MVLYHQAGEAVYFPNHQVTLDASILDHQNWELYSAHDTATRYTVKYQSFTTAYEVERAKYYREQATLMGLKRHPKILPLIDALEVSERDYAGYHLFDCTIVHSLRSYSQSSRLADIQLIAILKEICEALNFVHTSGFQHRNLTLDSVYMLQDGTWALGDFVASMPANYQLPDADYYRDVEMMTTQSIRAPELLDVSTAKQCSSKSDMWALGCILYELLSGQAPFASAKLHDQIRGIFLPLSDKVSSKLSELVDRLLTVEPTLRPSAQDVIAGLQVMERGGTRATAVSKGSLIGNLLKTSTRSWIENATAATDSMPEHKYVEKLVAKAWQKPQKIDTFYHFLTLRPLSVTIVAIKSLMLFHKYLCHGPKEVLSTRSLSHEKFLMLIDETWTNPAAISVPDQHKCEYFNGLIRQYCKLLKAKTNIMQKYPLTGLWEGELTIGVRELEQFIMHWNRLNHFVKGLFLDVSDLPEIRAGLATMQIDESFKMMKIIKAVIERFVALGANPRLEPIVKGFNDEIARSQMNVNTLRSRKPTSSPPVFDTYAITIAVRTPEHQQFQSGPKPPMAPLDIQSFSSSSARPAFKPGQQPSNYLSSEKTEEQKEPKSISLRAEPPRAPMQELSSVPAKQEMDVQPQPPRGETKQQQQPKNPTSLDPSQFGQIEGSWVIKESQLVQQEAIGGGSSCTVFKGTYKRTAVAIKVLRSVLNGDHLKEFSRELSALLHLRHPNLVLFMGAVFHPQLAIVTEFCSGDTLFKLLHQEKNVQLNWRQKLKMCKDVAHGMTYLHESEPPILHRDLKSLNLLLTDRVIGPNDSIMVKITDFGVSKFLDDSASVMNTGQMGTCHWMAPEVLAGHNYSLPADVYSYGIVLWEIVCRDTPYRGVNPTLIPYRVLNCNERPNLDLLPSSCPEGLKSLIVRCWQTDPALRPTFPEVLDALDAIDISVRTDNLLL